MYIEMNTKVKKIVDTPLLLFTPLLSSFFYFFHFVQLLFVDVYLSITVVIILHFCTIHKKYDG